MESAHRRLWRLRANRVRIVRELLEVTREAVAGQCAVALRISLEELRARPSDDAPSEAHEVVHCSPTCPISGT